MQHHSRLSIQPRGLIAAVACIALFGSVGMELLGGVMRDAQNVRLKLAEITALVNRQSALEWQAVATEEREEALWAAIAANDSAIGSASALLGAKVHDPELATFVGLVGRYRAAVGLMAELIRRGDVERAEATDEELVDPLFGTIHAEATRLLATYGATSEAISLGKNEAAAADRRLRDLER